MKKLYSIIGLILLSTFVRAQIPPVSIATKDTTKKTAPRLMQTTAATTSETAPALPVIVPPSPNAASLGMYGDVPVGHYTGIPSINIPLYEIVAGSIKVPISLSYHAGGIKVAQEASWVGLGWALNAGGVITRSVRGWDDLESYRPQGYPSGLELPPSIGNMMDAGNTTPGHVGQYISYQNGEADCEPDIIYYNFGAYSGKMVFRKGSPEPMLINQDPIKVTYNNHSGWTVKTPDGCTWYFGTEETTETWEGLMTFDPRHPQPEVISGWYLDSIRSPRNDVVRFHYKKGAETRSQTIAVTNFQNAVSGATLSDGLSNNYSMVLATGSSTNYVLSRFETYEILLERIEFNGNRIEFETADRTDLLYTGSIKPQRLSQMSVKSGLPGGAWNETASYRFDFDYFQNSRLQLKGVTDKANGRHSFAYDPQTLPEKTSYAVDHWGYYNGKTENNTFIPAATLTIDHNTRAFFSGADREPTEKAKAGILTKITYPTGGYTVFDYELNNYGNFTSKPYTESEKKQMRSGEELTLTADISVNISYHLTVSMNPGAPIKGSSLDFDYPLINQPYLEIQKKRADNTWETKQFRTYGSLNQLVIRDEPPYKLTQTFMSDGGGTYRFVIHSTPEISIDCETEYVLEHTPSDFRLGGGLRIRQKTMSDGNIDMITRYDYTQQKNGRTVSAGKLMTFPGYYADLRNSGFQVFDITDTYPLVRTFGFTSQGIYYVASSETHVPLGTSAQGNAVGYDRVTETQISAGGNGKTVYHFRNKEESLPPAGWFPGIPTLPNISNGQLLKKEYFDADNRLLKKEVYEYRRGKTENVKGLKIRYAFDIQADPTLIELGRPDPLYRYYTVYLRRFYDNPAEWWYLSRDRIVAYNTGGDSVVQANRYEYANSLHQQLTKQVTLASDNDSVIASFKYPHDVTHASGTSAESARQQLIADWHILALMEQSQTKNGKTRTTITEYKKFGKPALPYLIKTNTGPNQATENRVRYHSCDPHGNPTCVSYEDGPVTVYIWGYGGQYPVAEIRSDSRSETHYQTVIGRIGAADMAKLSDCPTDTDIKTIFDRLRSRSDMNNDLITSFTYRPLVGKTSETDPSGRTVFYEYDKAGRLERVKDEDGNIIRAHQYHYAR